MIDTLGGGGAERVLIYLLQKLDRSRFEAELFLMVKSGIYLPELPSDIPYSGIFNDSDAIRFAPFRLFYRLYRRSMLEVFKFCPHVLSHRSGIVKQYDLGISFCEGHNTPLLRLKAKHFRKKIAWIHVDLRTHACVLNRQQLYRAVMAADKLFFVSGDARRSFSALYPEADTDSRSEVVYNPIDIPGIRSVVQGKEKRQSEEITLIAIGRLTRQKRFDKLVEVHRRLLDKGVRHRLCILGEGELRGELEEQIERLGVEASCSLPGFLPPYSLLDRADIFVSTSDYEGLPVVVCEAMALAKPIVCTDITGPRELLEDGKYGLLVENHVDAIEWGLEQMITRPELREHYSQLLDENRDRFIFSAEVTDIERKLLAL